MNKNSLSFSEFILGKRYRKQVLQQLFRKPDYEYTINELTKQVSGSYMSVRNFLQELAEFSVIKIKKKGNYSLVKLNKDSIYNDAILKLLRSDVEPLRRIAEQYASKMRDKFGDKLKASYLFGSVAKGSADRQSDIDVLLLTLSDSEEEVKEQAPKIAQKMKYGSDNPISPVVESKQEFDDNLEQGAKFETEVKQFGIKLEED